ncbi:MAG TPA: DeoR/GlpR transcriptional regulator [Firmicutes bacterium]|nr:DeoR/GlpR transcriptional regulator [Bacillota bacterium]
MLAQARRLELLELIRKQGIVEVQALAERFQCSAATIRNDLSALERRGLVQRTHGGAFALDYGREQDTPVTVRQALMSEEKAFIGKLAAELVTDGDLIMVDSSSTVLELVRRIKDRRHLTVVTNAVNVAVELAGVSSITVVMVGGVLRHPSLSIVGGDAEEAVARFRVRKVFLSTRGITLDRGLTDTSLEEARLHAAMLEAGSERYLLADSSKFGVEVFTSAAPLERLTAVITDRRPPEPFLRTFKEKGVRVVWNRTELQDLIRHPALPGDRPVPEAALASGDGRELERPDEPDEEAGRNGR